MKHLPAHVREKLERKLERDGTLSQTPEERAAQKVPWMDAWGVWVGWCK